MAGEVIDSKIVSTKYRHTGSHKVRYFLYKHDGDKVSVPKETDGGEKLTDYPEAKFITGVCFSGLLRGAADGECNRLYYPMPDDENNIRLTLDEKKEFIRLCKQNKLLPSYVRLNWIRENESKLVLDLEGITVSLLYMYVCTFRYIREDPGFVRALVYLVKKKGANFFSAYVLASKVCLSAGGHATLSNNNLRAYMKGSNPDTAPIDTRFIMGLYMYVNSPEEYDKRKVGDGKDHMFDCNITVDKVAAKVKSRTLAGKEVLNPVIGCALRSGSLDKFKTVIDLVKEEEGNGKDKG